MSGSSINQAHRHWEYLRQGNLLPCRSQLDPVDIPALLSASCLMDILEGAMDFRYSLVGGKMQAITEPGLKGKMLSEIDNQRAPSRIHSLFQKTVLMRTPGFGLVEYSGSDPSISALDIGVFPFSTHTPDQAGVLWTVVEVLQYSPEEQFDRLYRAA